MIVAVLCAAAVVIVLLGVFLGWVIRAGDVRAAYRYGWFQGVQWSRQRGALEALERVYKGEQPRR